MALSPMMQQYLLLKEQYKDAFLFFRLGDFYEMFFDDAVRGARELELTLTGRDCGLEERAPMCGVPYHAVDTYINRLIERGYKVAICEQLTDPKESKGLVERDVIRVITPGTVTEQTMLEEKLNNYLCAVSSRKNGYGISWADLSTGEFFACEAGGMREVTDMLAMICPKEVLCSDKKVLSPLQLGLEQCSVTPLKASAFEYDRALSVLCEHFSVQSLAGFDFTKEDTYCGICAAGALLEYLRMTQKIKLVHIAGLRKYYPEQYLVMDSHTRKNLELVETIRGRSKKGSLLALLDQTCTPMGGRCLRSFVEQPLRQMEAILKRQRGVAELVESYAVREDLAEYLKQIYDIERLATKVAYQNINPRDCLSLKKSLQILPHVRRTLEGCTSEQLCQTLGEIAAFEELSELLERAVDPDAALQITEGGIIRDGFNPELDEMRSVSKGSRDMLAAIENREREATGIKNLKVSYNRVFGYYIEVSKSNIAAVPYHYERRQTLTNCERYITPELKELEAKLLGVEERMVKLEYELFLELRRTLLQHLKPMQATAKAVAELDAMLSLARTAVENRYVCPSLNGQGVIEIEDGRHPVVEHALQEGQFVPNNTSMDNGENRFMVITGPNMAGKSTYMRQVAVITLLAHMGSFVPAKRADIAVVDKIFTRVGASDDLSSGQSTFMVEMNEVANILHNATPNSLVILDEIGRGTSTFDGLSIAWAVTEYIADQARIGAKTLFATHYHELSELEGRLAGVKNYCVAVKEHGDDVIFLRKILRGSADKSFGIQVARLAGLPAPVLKRANQILKRLEQADISKSQISANILEEKALPVQASQMNMLASPVSQEIIQTLLQTNINEITPVQAFSVLCELREKAKREER